MTITEGRETATRTGYDLARLIHPVEPRTFLDEYYERRPLHVQRNSPGYYHDVLTLEDLDRLLSLPGAGLNHIRVVIDGQETPVSELGSGGANSSANELEALYERYRTGHTIVLNSLETHWEPLRRLAKDLGAEICGRVQMNIYLTPPGNRGFKPHHDTHDVFVAQVHGTKRWQLFGAPVELPLRSQRYDKSGPEPTTPEQEFDLRDGDILYLPRGTVHAGSAQDEASAHITLGIHPVLWAQIIGEAVHDLMLNEPRLRTSLPPGFARDAALQGEVVRHFTELLDLVRDSLSPERMTLDAVRRAVSAANPGLRHHLTDLGQVEHTDLETRVYRRADAAWHLGVDDGVAELSFHNKSVRLPAHVADEIRFVAESNGTGFTAASIPGGLDADGRLVLIRTLLREGFLTLGR